MGLDRRLNPAIAPQLGQIDCMTGFLTELFEVLKLCAAIPFAKGVQRVQITYDNAGTAGEGSGVHTLQEILPAEPFVNVGHAHLDPVMGMEPQSAFGDINLANFTGPSEHILKQMQVNSLQMIKVELTSRYTFLDPLRDQPPLGKIEQIAISQSKLVLEDVAARLAV